MSVVDLHTHSTASDGEVDAVALVCRAAALGLSTIALTDHDTVEAVPIAVAEGQRLGVRVISGCEFSVEVWWGEMHLLGYFLPTNESRLDAFLTQQQRGRAERAGHIVDRLKAVGVDVELADVTKHAAGKAIGRPHVARALVEAGVVPDLQTAFDRYLAVGRPAFVPKNLPSVEHVTALVSSLGGVSAPAHLGGRATRTTLERLQSVGIEAVEARHPAHDVRTADRIEQLARTLGLVPTGGSDWHGDGTIAGSRAALGSVDVPEVWVEQLEARHEHHRGREEALR